MTVDLYTENVTDSEEFVIAWLAQLIRAAHRRKPGDPLPFALVREVTATEDDNQFGAYPTVSVHILDETADGCAALADDVHRRMLVLVRDPSTDVTLAGGRVVNAEWVETQHRPIWVDYEDPKIFRKVARYGLGLPFT